MLLRLLGPTALLAIALAVPASVQYSARDGVQFSVTQACAQEDPDEDPEAGGRATKPNTYCGSKVNKYAAW